LNINTKNTYPLVSVVTPFYNSEKYLSKCIESVLGQSYQKFEYILVDNCSTDGSLEIVEKYAKLDCRIKVNVNKNYLEQVENYNNAMRLISINSKYCKIVQADDWIFSNCLEEMVDVAENNSSIGIVGSLGILGKWIGCEGLRYPSHFIKGRDACRIYLIEGKNIFGNATSMLFSSKLVREKNPFYNINSIAEDIEICFELLKNCNYGFVHQVLVFFRTQKKSITAGIRDFNPYLLHRYIIMKKYGKSFLTNREYSKYIKLIENEYFMYLAKSMLQSKNKDFWEYHKAGLNEIGIKISSKVSKYIIKTILEIILNPMNTTRILCRRISK